MKQPSPFTIRLASTQDLDALADLHCDCFKAEDHVPVMLGKHYVRATYRWLVTGGEAYTLVADADGRIVGIIAVADRSFTQPMFKACLGEFMLSLLRNPKLLFEKKLWDRLFRRSDDMSGAGEKIASHPGVAQMTIGAVAADYRGQGVFPALVEATKTFSTQRGSRAIRAGIYKPNTPSRRVFIKGGWIETPQLETSDTVFYMAYLDPALPAELGIVIPN
jgi:GNAT superfamily N-acetyltransferase